MVGSDSFSMRSIIALETVNQLNKVVRVFVVFAERVLIIQLLPQVAELLQTRLAPALLGPRSPSQVHD